MCCSETVFKFFCDFVYFNWRGMVSCSIFSYKILLCILFSNLTPGYNLRWWWNDVDLWRVASSFVRFLY